MLAAAARWRLTATISLGIPKQKRVWNRPSVNEHTFCGKRMECPRAVQTSIGIDPLTSTCATARTCFGSRRRAEGGADEYWRRIRDFEALVIPINAARGADAISSQWSRALRTYVLVRFGAYRS
jgi:hypothetical protein